jgi:hypothetical protein
MPGQMAGFLLNWSAANLLVEFTSLSALIVWISATAAGVIATFSWTNWFSHKGTSPTRPATEAREVSRS